MKYMIAIACVLVSWVAAGPLAMAQTAAKTRLSIADLADPPNVHGFNVALVLGDQQGAATPDNLPAGAKKALADMRDFLPFKSYRLLDSQWILCCGGEKNAMPVISGRLRGIDEQQYAFRVEVLGMSGSKLSLRFWLGEEPLAKKPTYTFKQPDDAGFYDVVAQKRAEITILEVQLAEARKQYNAKHPEVLVLESKLEKAKRDAEEKYSPKAGQGKGAVIDSTFSMDVGETVVIGTSSLKGDKALIALLTAARRPGSQSSNLGDKR